MAEDFSGFASRDKRYGHMTTVNVSDAEITELEEIVAEPHVIGGQSFFERVQLAKAAACAGTCMNGSIVAPNVCKKCVHTEHTQIEDRCCSKNIIQKPLQSNRYLRYEYRMRRSMGL